MDHFINIFVIHIACIQLGAKINTPNSLLAFLAIFVAPPSDEWTASDNNKRTLIEASPDGWWYSSLISHNPNTRIVVFHTLPVHPAAKSSRRPEGFLDQLHESSTYISAIITKWEYVLQERYPRCTAAGSSYLEMACNATERWVAVGDAALAFDPLSSQGIMTALEMGIYLGLQLSQHIEKDLMDQDFDEHVRDVYAKVRGEYERQRAYYYSVVKRFPEEMFWEKVTCS